MKRMSVKIIPALVVLFALGGPHHAVAQQRYVIAPAESEVVYAMHHPMHDWTGVSHRAKGTVQFDAAGQPEAVDVRIPVLSFDSGNENRDSHMAETVESYIFRDVRFHGTDVTVDPDSIGRWLVSGQLDFHGVQHDLQVPVAVTRSDDDLEAVGTFELALTDYDIELPSLLMVKVKDWLKVDFDLMAHASPTTEAAGGSQ